MKDIIIGQTIYNSAEDYPDPVYNAQARLTNGTLSLVVNANEHSGPFRVYFNFHGSDSHIYNGQITGRTPQEYNIPPTADILHALLRNPNLRCGEIGPGLGGFLPVLGQHVRNNLFLAIDPAPYEVMENLLLQALATMKYPSIYVREKITKMLSNLRFILDPQKVELYRTSIHDFGIKLLKGSYPHLHHSLLFLVDNFAVGYYGQIQEKEEILLPQIIEYLLHPELGQVIGRRER